VSNQVAQHSTGTHGVTTFLTPAGPQWCTVI